MIMKRFIALTLFMLAANCVLAQINANEHEWKATIKVVDESGAPFSGALATIGYYTNSVSTVTDGITDTNGIFTLTHTAHSEYADISFEAKKDGYYSIWQQVNLQAPYEEAKWNPTKVLVLKKIGKPIAMYARRLNTHVPDLDKPVGFDLAVGDWIAPYGKGISTDINFMGHFDKYPDGESDFTLTVSFPKDGDGIQEFYVPDVEKGSGLHSPHEAPANGYQSQWVQTDKRKPGQAIETNQDPNRNYFYRVRTVKDHEGNIVSAHYGKIYGDFMQFSYYLNPTPNDRNIEYDPKQNLLQGLQSFEQVSQP